MKKIWLIIGMLVFSHTLFAQSVDELFDSAIEKQEAENVQGAIADYTQILQIEPKRYDAYFKRGLLYRQNDASKMKEAQEDFRKAIEYQPADLSFEEKIELYTEYRGVTQEIQGYDVPDDLITQIDVMKNARIKELTEQLSSDLDEYDRLETYQERADLWKELQQYEKAIEDGLKLADLTSDSPDESARWKLYVAEIYDEYLTNPSAALPFYNQAIKVLLPDAEADDIFLGDALLHRAVILTHQGQDKEACADYRKGKKMVPKYWIYEEIDACKASKKAVKPRSSAKK